MGTVGEPLPVVKAPTLVLWGDDDGIVGPGYGQAYAAAIPGARVRLIESAGHLPQLEAPEPTLRAITDATAS